MRPLLPSCDLLAWRGGERGSTIARSEQAQTVWGPGQRQLTLGIVLVVSLVAFESLAVVTIAPEMTAQLGGRNVYGWLYSSFFLASILGTVVSGHQADVTGPRRCLSVGLPTFIVGLVLSGLAPSMSVLLLGRAFQGLGSGILVTALYVAVNVAYDDSVRSRMFALMSSAWVVPALGGPLLAGVIATYASWRWVFLGLIPLTLFVSFMIIPGLPSLPGRAAAAKSRLLAAFRVVLGAGLFLFSLSQAIVFIGVVLALVGVVIALSGLRPLLPKGTLTLVRGLPAAIAVHGFVFAAFSTVEGYLALALTGVLGLSSVMAGGVIAAAALSWTGGTWLQDKLDDTRSDKRQKRALFGGALLVVGIACQVTALYVSFYPLLISLLGWMTAGLGVGLTHTATLVLIQHYTPQGEEGKTSSAMYVFEQLAFAVAAGIAGALLSLDPGWHTGNREGLVFVYVLSLCLAGLGATASWRLLPGDASTRRI